MNRKRLQAVVSSTRTAEAPGLAGNPPPSCTRKMNRCALCAALAVLALTAGCFAISRNSSAPSATVTSIRKESGSRDGKTTLPVLEAEVMRFGDDLTATIAQAADEFGDQVGTPQARALALSLKTGAANNSMIIASGPNPTANLLDMVVLVTLGRMTFEDYWVPRYGPPAQPMLDVSRGLEKEIWSVAAQVLTPQQLNELRELIRVWRAEHPGQLEAGVRFRDFAEIAAGKTIGSKARPGSLLGIFLLDPLAGLDPATREMEQTRYVADRALYVLQRMPNLLRWQSELLFSQTLATPGLQQMVSNSTQFAQSAEQLSQAVEKLPEQLSLERQKLMNDVTAQAPQWQAILVQLQQTFQAGNEMATTVNSLAKSLGNSGGDTNPVTTSSPSAAKPFDVNEYGAAATQIGAAAQQLNTLVATLDKSTPQLDGVVERTRLEGREMVDYTFHRALCLLALALLGFVLAMLVYRYLATRLFGKSTNQS
jgi:hypothetical protein